ncbi:hypothetical protein [uncultured Secundilactobacillus sp.]|uniref:hypothetical protein n=1 Tax=uncultured Secundilactobacillus sp. TaxID=2813935 RepID=UPI0025851F1B|nr:hypothetical protein [uncultured Secundilactobacillus sp.]
METIEQQLQRAQKTGHLVELYRYGDSKHFSVGYVVVSDSKFMLFKQVSTDGALDGAAVIRLNTISQVKDASDYLTALTALIALARQKNFYDIWHIDDVLNQFDFDQHSILKTVLKWAFKNDRVISLGIHPGKREEKYTGFVGALKSKKAHFNYIDRSDLSARWAVKLAYADINYLEFASFETYGATAIMERFMAADFH